MKIPEDILLYLIISNSYPMIFMLNGFWDEKEVALDMSSPL